MTSQPRRVQLQRTKGWRMPPDTVKVDRTTQWGNPYAVRPGPVAGQYTVMRLGEVMWVVRTGLSYEVAAQMAVDLFERITLPGLDLTPLRGKNIGCWCGEGMPCHGNVLLRAANPQE